MTIYSGLCGHDITLISSRHYVTLIHEICRGILPMVYHSAISLCSLRSFNVLTLSVHKQNPSYIPPKMKSQDIKSGDLREYGDKESFLPKRQIYRCWMSFLWFRSSDKTLLNPVFCPSVRHHTTVRLSDQIFGRHRITCSLQHSIIEKWTTHIEVHGSSGRYTVVYTVYLLDFFYGSIMCVSQKSYWIYILHC